MNGQVACTAGGGELNRGGGGERIAGGDAAIGGGISAGGGDVAQLLSASTAVIDTPAARMLPICEVMHAVMTGTLEGETPESTIGPARAVTHDVHTREGFAQGATAAVKLSC